MGRIKQDIQFNDGITNGLQALIFGSKPGGYTSLIPINDNNQKNRGTIIGGVSYNNNSINFYNTGTAIPFVRFSGIPNQENVFKPSGNFTIFCRVKAESTASGDLGSIFGTWPAGGTNPNYFGTQANPGYSVGPDIENNWVFCIPTGTAAGRYLAIKAPRHNPKEFVEYTNVYKKIGSEQYMRIYRNGQIVANYTGLLPMIVHNTTVPVINNIKYGTTPNNFYYFIGDIDCFAFWNRALSEEEVSIWKHKIGTIQPQIGSSFDLLENIVNREFAYGKIAERFIADSNYLFADTGGTIPIEPGGNVMRWNSTHNTGVFLYQVSGNSNYAPKWIPPQSGLNNQYGVLNFNGTNQWLEGNPPNANYNWTNFIVFRPTGQSGTIYCGNSDNIHNFYYVSGNNYKFDNTAYSQNITINNNAISGQWTIACTIADDDSLVASVYFNEIQKTTIDDSHGFLTRWYLGRRNSLNDRYFNGDIRELIFCQVNSETWQNIVGNESYCRPIKRTSLIFALAKKYGISLTGAL